MKLASPLGWVQQAGAPEKALLLGFTCGLMQVCLSESPTSTRSLNLR